MNKSRHIPQDRSEAEQREIAKQKRNDQIKQAVQAKGQCLPGGTTMNIKDLTYAEMRQVVVDIYREYPEIIREIACEECPEVTR